MQNVLIALILAISAQGPGAASEKKDVIVTVRQFVDNFNKGDAKAAADACADETSIIDDFPPFEWHGDDSCSKWLKDYDDDAKKKGISDGKVTLNTPRHVVITDNRAYVVVPANYTYKQKGKLVRQIGSIYTLTLKKGSSGWRITGGAWAKR